MRRIVLVVVLLSWLAVPATAPATHAQPAYDRGALKETYKPNGFLKPGDAISPVATDLPQADAGGLYNPSGHWSAYDTNVFETLTFPLRQAGDASNTDPPGSGDPRHGWCPPDPMQPGFLTGRCANHAAEYRDHYERTMKTVLRDFGVVVKRYTFDTGPDAAPIGLPGGVTSRLGASENIAAIVPGTDHPEEMVVVGAHYDQTDGGPASSWDSAEGHASMIRMAAIMADYWRRTGTRPSATVVFMPWDQEENGSLGSRNWLETTIAPDTAPQRIRAYFNDDPCATAYPAFYHGIPSVQVPIVMQLTNPTAAPDAERTEAFNAQAGEVVDEFFADIDDEVDTLSGPQPVYIDAQRGQVVEALGGLLAFGSDYSNFEAVGVPIFNLFPDILGPHADGSPGFSAEGVTLLHTPRDNIPSWNAFTDGNQTGLTASDGWMTGMEFCSQLHARFMLKPTMGGAQTVTGDPVAYYEALPNDAPVGKRVAFDAGGSYQYTDTASRGYVPEADLQFRWDFADGSPAAFGRAVKHVYKQPGVYPSKLTVTNRTTRATDTMTLPVTIVAEDAGTETDPDGQNVDPGLRPAGSIVACQGSTLQGVRVVRSGRGLRIDTGGKAVRVEVLRVGRRTDRRLADFAVTGTGRFDGKGAAAAGSYVVRLSTRGTGSRPDSLSLAFERRGAGLVARRPFQRPDSCDGASVFRLSSPDFGARKLGIAFSLTTPGKVRVDVLKGKRRIRRFTRSAPANRLVKIGLGGRGLRTGEYRIVLRSGSRALSLYARRTR